MKLLVSTVITLISAACFAADAPPAVSVLVTAFAPLGEASESAWIGQAIQQDLLAELSRMPQTAALSPAAVSATTRPAEGVLDSATAQKMARQAGAMFVLFGSYQISNNELRVTAQMVDARNGLPVGALKATGGVGELFGLEDLLAEQARKLVLAQRGGQPAQVEVPVAPPGIQEIAGQGGLAIRPMEPLREGAGDPELEWLLRRSLDREYSASLYRYNYLYGTPYLLYYPVGVYGYPGYGYRGWGGGWSVENSGGYYGRHGSVQWSVGGRRR